MSEPEPSADVSWVRREDAHGREVCPVCGRPDGIELPLASKIVAWVVIVLMLTVSVCGVVWLVKETLTA